MKFATAKEIVAMVVISAAVLYALDYWKNPQLWHAHAMESSGGHDPQSAVELTLSMNGACSLQEIRQALTGLQGIDLAKARMLTAADKSLAEGAVASIPIDEVTKLDFAALDRALRQAGLVAGRMELSGVPHFGLQAEFPYVSDQSSDTAIEQRIGFVKAAGMGDELEWLDSVDMNRQRKMLTAYARYVEPGKSVNVSELIAGLDQVGLAPSSLHVVIGEHGDHPRAQ